MTETGVVRKIANEVVTVECSPTPTCEGCTTCSSGDGPRTMEAVNHSGSQLKEGDRVDVRVSASVTAQASFLVLILPLAMFVLFYFVVQRAAPSSSEALRVVAGIGGLLAGIGMNFLFKGKHRELPEIVSVRSDPVG